MKKLVLLRHGEVDGFKHRYLGKTDVSLSRNGRENIRVLGERIRDEKFDIVMSSPLKRCRETLTALNRPEKVAFDERLKEIDFGVWEGKTFAQINIDYSELVGEWSSNSADFFFPGGEKLIDFHRRINTFANHLYTIREEKILLVTHGGVIRHLICEFLHLPISNYLYFNVAHGRFVLLDLYSEGGVLSGLNKRFPHG